MASSLCCLLKPAGSWLSVKIERRLISTGCAGLVLRIFLLILPWILGIMTKQEGVIDTAVKDARVSTKYFIFQARA